MSSNTINQLLKYIKELSEQGAFEIWSPLVSSSYTDSSRHSCEISLSAPSYIYIPYMMNDAMECYIILEQATLVGHFDCSLMANTVASIETDVETDGRFLIVIKQYSSDAHATDHEPDNICTIWFHSATIHNKLYRFDEICHFWKEGYEQWSQLTYIIGTMYDKYLFNGDVVCNATELSIMKLIEFAPFRAYAPAPELFEELYDNTKEATLLMEQYAKQAHDYSYAFLCHLYSIFPKLNIARLLCKCLAKEKRYPLYQLLYKTAIKGASAYPSRTYLSTESDCNNLNLEIQSLRASADTLMKKLHFNGNYPDYHRGNIFARITEEHPFTIMDWEEITFSQKWMVSICNGKHKNVNLGFFDGNKNTSQVLTREEFIDLYS